MKFIELHAHDRIYFINPAQIITAIGDERAEPPYITVMLADPSPQAGARGSSTTLIFKGEDARRVFKNYE